MNKRETKRGYWKMIGYILTAAWIAWVLAETNAEMSHPLFDYIFIVPLAAWITAMVGNAAYQVWFKKHDNPEG